MSTKPVDYYEQRERDAILRTREILKRLPPACEEFISDIRMNTSPLTRLAYGGRGDISQVNCLITATVSMDDLNCSVD